MNSDEDGLFSKLADTLWNWRVNTSGDKNNLWMHKWDIHLLMDQSGLDTVVQWLEYHKDPSYARAFESKFQNLYRNVDVFYDTLIQGVLDEAQFHEQIQLLENQAKRLAQDVTNVGYLCLTDKTIMQRIIGNKGVRESEQTGDDASIHKHDGIEKKESHEGSLEPKAPEFLEQLLWIWKHGRKHWKLILLAIAIFLIWSALAKFDLMSRFYTLIKDMCS